MEQGAVFFRPASRLRGNVNSKYVIYIVFSIVALWAQREGFLRLQHRMRLQGSLSLKYCRIYNAVLVVVEPSFIAQNEVRSFYYAFPHAVFLSVKRLHFP